MKKQPHCIESRGARDKFNQKNVKKEKPKRITLTPYCANIFIHIFLSNDF